MQPMKLIYVNIGNLRPNPLQPRTGFDRDKLLELAESIKRVGILQPLVVREHETGFQIISGERRWKGAEIAGMQTVPVLLRRVNDENILVESLIENVHREDLSSVERENAIYSLWASGRYKTPSELSRTLGYRNGTVSEIIRAREFREKARIPEEIATKTIRETAALPEPERKKVIEKVVEKKVKATKVREIANIIKKATEPVKEALLKDRITPEIAKEILRIPDERTQRHLIEKVKTGLLADEDAIKDEVSDLRKALKEKKAIEVERDLEEKGLEFQSAVLEWVHQAYEFDMESVKCLSKEQKKELKKELQLLVKDVINPLLKKL